MGALVFSVAVVACHGLAALAAAVGIGLAAAVLARLELGKTLRQVLAVDLFVVAMLLMLPFTTPGEEVFRLWGLSASREGFLKAIEIGLKANAVVLMLLALVGTLEAATLGRALKHLRLPDGLIHLLLFTVRYIEVLQREYARLRLAMKARAFRPRSNLHTWRSIGYLLGMLLVRSFDRSERILAAMKCRGFDGRLHLIDDMAYGRADALFALLSLLILAALAALEVA